MKIEEAKEYIEENKSKFPLPFNNSTFKVVVDKELFVYSKKYKDADYSVHKFYKPITRF